MKQSPVERSVVKTERFLILSDGKPGHENQAIAFAKLQGFEYDLSPVKFHKRGGKALSYLFDRLKVYSDSLFTSEKKAHEYAAVVSAGSGTYYANKTLAKQLGCRSIAIMLPKGYRLDFDLIIAQQHDNPPTAANIIDVPINLTYVEPSGIVTPEVGKKYIALIVGGDSHHSKIDADQLREQIVKILELFPEHDVWMTTSRRTPAAVESMLREFSYQRAVYYSQEPINPIPDYLAHSDYVFLTADSSSMISEAVSFGTSCVEVLHSSEKIADNSKFYKLIMSLSAMNCLHLFEGQVGNTSEKINLTKALRGVRL